MPLDAGLARLARRCGVATEYDDVRGERQLVSAETIRATLGAMGIDASDDHAIERALGEFSETTRWLPAVCVRRQSASIDLPLEIPADRRAETFWLVVHREDGSRGELVVTPGRDARPDGVLHLGRLELGYHTAELYDRGGLVASTQLIVVPQRGYLPAAVEHGGRVWGPTVQLYALRESGDWGIGGFRHLRELVETCRTSGAGVIGLSPLHALFSSNPDHCAPYSPSSRAFLQWLHLDVEAIPELRECPSACELLETPGFHSRLAKLRRSELIDHAAVAAAKREVLELLWERLPDHPPAFARYTHERGELLAAFATFEALDERFRAQGLAGWESWPAAYRRPGSDAVSRFAAEHADRVGFFQWLQWQSDRQLEAIGRTALAASLGIGLYQDLAVSVDSGGFESWYWQDVFSRGATIGAPPDDFNLLGQNWGLLPWIPGKLTETAYRPFIDCLRSNMRHAGALRIDHVMGLMRSFWVPRGMEARRGTYVRYPFDELLGVLALESVRNRCMVIGEDLGTVPDEVRDGLKPAAVLSYRLLYFSRRDDQSFVPPAELPPQSVVAVSTHDLPTLAAWWDGGDIRLRRQLGLMPEETSDAALHEERARDRTRLLSALRQTDLLPAGIDPDDPPCELSAELVVAVHRYLARSPAMLSVFQLEDALGLREQANVPGTTDQHPNWRRRLPLELGALGESPGVCALNHALRDERPR